MKRLRALAVFVYDFVVGDDWRIALAVVVGLALAAAAARTSIPAWWVLPVFVIGSLGWSLRRARRLATLP
jgi:hypothetical protein